MAPESKAQSKPNTPATQPQGQPKRPQNAPGRTEKDKEAPHGRGPDGKPLAPYGTLPDGKPRVYPKRDDVKIDLALLGKPHAVTEELAAAVRPARVRSPEQQAVDKVVADLYAEWEQAGSPSEWKAIPKRRYHVSPEAASAVRFLIIKAGTLHGVRVRFGKAGLRDADGNEVVVFAAVKKSTKTRKPKA